MDTITKITKLMLASAALVLAAGALIFALKYNSEDAHAVSAHRASLPMAGQVFTASADGKTLYHWEFDRRARRWKRSSHRKVARK